MDFVHHPCRACWGESLYPSLSPDATRGYGPSNPPGFLSLYIHSFSHHFQSHPLYIERERAALHFCLLWFLLTPMLAAHYLLIFILGGYTLNTLINLLFFRGLRTAAPPDNAPLVSILIPARNEARNIEACVSSLLKQDYPRYEVIVLDDNSEDDTAEMVMNLYRACDNEQVRKVLLRGDPLAEGWTGKGWACHQLSKVASGDYLLFIDADTTHASGTLSAAVAFAQKHKTSLLSAWPRLITKTLGEKLIVPIIPLIGFAFFPHWLLPILQRFPSLARLVGTKFCRTFGAANGQFMFFTRRAYDQIGGHASVHDHVVEDVALGRQIAQRTDEGLRLMNIESIHFSTVRMYQSFGESWHGFTKNLRAAFDREGFLFWLFIACLVFCWLLPCFNWIWVRGVPLETSFLAIGLIYLTRFLITLRFRLSWLNAFLHPVGILLIIGICLHSWYLSITGKVSWKGRTYKPNV